MAVMTVSMPLQFLDNAVLAWGLAACGLAQLSKLVIELVLHRRWRPAVLIETGGMPSSHSALVTGTAAAAGWQEGFNSAVFALAATVAFVVMYDASGVRRSAGFTAERVNALPDAVWDTVPEQPLKERLGHSRTEVLVGSLMGPAIALIGLTFVGSPLQLAHTITDALG
ncbi:MULTISPECIES: divergent PAP2 family protein [unclassified Synechococcus]|mgnify:FL=1|uniref:divergent PAP2 family protein n=1 Tax=unclassified Synechococcus TaxID=2626047 RepID=UPI000C5D5B6A|nr:MULTISPECIES: divergent PAP2 family protein [unclassified Synechococcus]MAN18720.1 phosphatidic acid phosphatase [Synechococcus sp. EAC657]MEC7247576.1 divergent PAP2 family protein [Cyanobacteriota bacterium]MEC7896407.1 divergent PAP2 family protein [Cyanobacteriota bacterium]MEC8095998.1 divergent PAP2 family protein [Cyanobacteriota bacterium]|tara:strand:- start:699 stop:1205 length:507 start_codon:yes stop_codon:yes gene_type:complete